jgi:mRNA interferase MazF
MAQIFQRGEILNVDLGTPPQEIKGHEQGYNRPCVVIKSFPHLELVVITPCTSQEPKISHFTIVKLLKNSGGLSADSYALCHQIRTVSYKRVISRRGMLDTKDFLKIQTVLLDTLEI